MTDMSWNTYCLMATIIAFLGWPAFAMDVVVVESNSPLMPPGTVLQDDTDITLDTGMIVKVLGADGSINILKGVYTGPMFVGEQGEENGVLIGVVRSLISDSKKRDSTLGAVRSVTEDDKLGLWDIPIEKSGIYCVLSESKPALVRRNSQSSITASLKKRGGKKVKFDWPKGQTRSDWPVELQLEDGATYAAKVSGQPLPKKLRIYIIESERTEAAAIPLLVEKKCTSQARRLLARLMGP